MTQNEIDLLSDEPQPTSGFWIIERLEDDVPTFYSFEALEPSLDIEDHVYNSVFVQYFINKDAAADCLNQIGNITEI